jgi:hypothetical protein
MKKLLKAVAFIGIIFAIAYVLGGCRVHKNISSEQTKFDSSYIMQLQEQIHNLTLENEHLQHTINEMEYTDVVFDNNCDSILRNALLKAGCNVDSINAVLALYKSKIKVYADGAVEYDGAIKSFNRAKSKWEEKIKDMQRVNDSLVNVKQVVDVRVEKQTEWKERVVKRGISGLMWTIFVLLIIAAFIVGFWLCWKYKDNIQEQLDAEEKYS